jgi:1-deoxy-D-xylulose-5-phosphate reductoisomerase
MKTEPLSVQFVSKNMDVKNLVILGSTGSIGRSTTDVIDTHPGAFRVRALAAFSNVDLLIEQVRKYRPEYVCLVNPERANELRERLSGENVKILVGEEELLNLPSLDNVDVVLNAVVGAAGLRASLETIKQGRNLALANKESLVAGGPLFPPLCEKSEGTILPVDSEHSAIWQALRSGEPADVRKIILTSSGGPFRQLPKEEFETVTLEQALNHPTWNMGAKITIDSATMANKGLEVIEAVWLFDVTVDQVEVVIHPQSVIHSMVEFVDSSIIAQLSMPDMRLPISYALFWPERIESDFGRVDWKSLSGLTFEPPDLEKFRALALAFDAAATGGTAPAVYNAANEEAVQAFLDKQIRFTEIADIIEDALNNVDIVAQPDLEAVLMADRSARANARMQMEKHI